MSGSPSSDLNTLDPTPTTTAVETSSQAPEMPPRPLSPMQQAKVTLKEAFPSIDDSIIEAVLIASGGKIEPAFNALLGKKGSRCLSLPCFLAMTDPSYKPDAGDVAVRNPEPTMVCDFCRKDIEV